MIPVKTRAIYRNGVLKPDIELDLPDGAAVEVEISSLTAILSDDPKDALLDDAETLKALYAEFADEERELAQLGLTHYADMLHREEEQL